MSHLITYQYIHLTFFSSSQSSASWAQSLRKDICRLSKLIMLLHVAQPRIVDPRLSVCYYTRLGAAAAVAVIQRSLKQ